MWKENADFPLPFGLGLQRGSSHSICPWGAETLRQLQSQRGWGLALNHGQPAAVLTRQGPDLQCKQLDPIQINQKMGGPQLGLEDLLKYS